MKKIIQTYSWEICDRLEQYVLLLSSRATEGIISLEH